MSNHVYMHNFTMKKSCYQSTIVAILEWNCFRTHFSVNEEVVWEQHEFD